MLPWMSIRREPFSRRIRFGAHGAPPLCVLRPVTRNPFRQQKVRRLSQSPEWLPHLRVCWDMPEDRLNCGKCEKCLRTMIGLSIEGASALCPVLPELKPEAVAQLTYASKSSSFY